MGYIMGHSSVSDAGLATCWATSWALPLYQVKYKPRAGLHHGPLLCIRCRTSHVGYIMGPSSVSGAELTTWVTSWTPPLCQVQDMPCGLHQGHLLCMKLAICTTLHIIAGSFFCMRDGLATCATVYSIGGPPLYMYMQNRQSASFHFWHENHLQNQEAGILTPSISIICL